MKTAVSVALLLASGPVVQGPVLSLRNWRPSADTGGWSSVDTVWTVGSRVHANNLVCARTDALSTVCGTLRATGDKGTIRGGPTVNSKYGLSWFVHYDTPPDGWSTAAYLTLDTLFVPPPPPPPSGPTPIRFFTVAPMSMTLEVGDVQSLQATVRDSLGRDLLDRQVSFTSNSPSIVAVQTTGTTSALVTAASIGVDTVQESVEGRGWLTVITVVAKRATVASCDANPPAIGCGMLVPQWLLLGVDSVSRTYGPWFEMRKGWVRFKAVRVIVSDTTP